MHLTPILLGLVASASAIDIGFHVGWDCSGAATVVRHLPERYSKTLPNKGLLRRIFTKLAGKKCEVHRHQPQQLLRRRPRLERAHQLGPGRMEHQRPGLRRRRRLLVDQVPG